MQHYSNLRLIRKDHIKPAPTHSNLRGLWLYGNAGVGKSKLAREIAGDIPFYPKMCNKWWDGYAGERIIIMDDVDANHSILGHHLKIWADRYGFIGESKCGAVAPDYDRFIVTSQYSPEEIWGNDEKTIQAIRRRFECKHLIDPL